MFEPTPESLELAQQPERWTLNLQNVCLCALRYCDGGISRLAGQDRHFAETVLHLHDANPSADTLIIRNVDIESSINEDVKSITSRGTLSNDCLAGRVDE